jgi:serine/threonine protein kinase
MYKKQPLNKIIPNVSKEGLYIMKKMLKVDPNKRFSAKKLLGEPYFQSIHLRTMIEKIKSMSPHIRTIEVQSDYPKSEGKHAERIKRQE